MLKAVIFDMDGVIVDSEPLHVKSERQVFTEYGVDLSDEELRGYMGRSSRVLFRDIIAKYHLDARLDDIYPKHIDNLVRLYREEGEPITGVLDLMDSLSKEGIALALASSSDMALIATVVDKFRLSNMFSAAVSGEEVHQTKPNPEIFLETSRRLGHPSESCVVIEDSQAGIQASAAAGMACVGFRSPNSLTQDLSEASLIVDDLRDLNPNRLRALVDGV